MTVTLCGHSDVYDNGEIRAKVYKTVEELINEGADKFLLSGYGQFDLLCAYLVRNIKRKYTNIESVLVVPYRDRKYDEGLYDCVLYPASDLEKVNPRYAIIARNEYMVNKSDIVIAYVKHLSGGAAKTLSYAQRKKKRIIMID